MSTHKTAKSGERAKSEKRKAKNGGGRRHFSFFVFRFSLFTAYLCSCFFSGIVRAAPATMPSAPTGDYELHEWVILVADANQPHVNAVSEFKSSLPPFVPTRRSAVDEKDANQPMPIGVIRIIGQPAGDDQQTMDVLLEPKAGVVNSHWPKAETRGNRLLWRDTTLSAAPPRMAEVDPKNWFAELRAGNSEYLSFHGSGDRCLVYDLEVPFKMPIKITGEGPKYSVTNTGTVTLHDLEFYKPASGGWQTALLAELRPHSARPATRSASAATKSVAAGASTQPTTAPSSSFTLSDSNSSTMPVGAWKDRLAATGLAPIDTNLILSILRTQGASEKRLTAIAELDRADLDRLIPEDVVPVPRKTVRVGLVIFRNIDPGIHKEVEQLIAQLGDDNWAKRQAASKALADLGRAAEPQLQAATKNKDMEIVFRAEKLLAAIKNSSH